MQRWRHAGVGQRCALVASVVLGALSLALYQSAYAAATSSQPVQTTVSIVQQGHHCKPYPGCPTNPPIRKGPALACTNDGSSRATWVPGFIALSTATFRVDNRPAGATEVASNGAALVQIAFLAGYVEVDGNAQVPVHPGRNYVIVYGHAVLGKHVVRVGVRLPFSTPPAGSTVCSSTTNTTTPSTTSVSTSTLPKQHKKIPPSPPETTVHGFYPTTLARVIETPLLISPNKVILETSLLSGVLAAALAAGALGSMWGGDGRDGGDGADATGGTGSEPAGEAASEGAGAPTEAPPAAPSSPAPVATTANPGAFVRQTDDPSGGAP